MVSLLAQEKSTIIKLADGEDYTLPPIDLTTLANIEKTMGFSLRKFSEKFENETMQTLLTLVYALLKETYPQITKEEAGKLVTLPIFANLSSTIAQIMAIAG